MKSRGIALLWITSILCFHASEAIQREPIYHSQEEYEAQEPPTIFPTKKIVHLEGDALEAVDMLNTSSIKPGEVVNATEIFEGPKVVDLGGKTHEESGNTTLFSNSLYSQYYTEGVCFMTDDWLDKCEDSKLNLTFIINNQKEIRDIPINNCKTIVINNKTEISCSVTTEWMGKDTNLTNIICPFPKDLLSFLNNSTHTSSCPGLRSLFTKITEPTFKCSDKEEGNVRITVCQIAKQWLKNGNISAKLNCTNSSNSSTGTETCIISNKIVQKNFTQILNCTFLIENITCTVPKEWMKYNVFSKLECIDADNPSFMGCMFPTYILHNNVTNDISSSNSSHEHKIQGSLEESSMMNCISNGNDTEVQCHIPQEWLSEDQDIVKLLCTNNHSNDTQKICSLPQEWLMNKTINYTIKAANNSSTSHLCLIPHKWLYEDAKGSGLNCSTELSGSDIIVCRAPNEGANITETVCPLLNEFKDVDSYNCTLNFEGNDTVFYCIVPENSTDLMMKNETILMDSENAKNVTLSPEGHLINSTDFDMDTVNETFEKNISTEVDCKNVTGKVDICSSRYANSSHGSILNVPGQELNISDINVDKTLNTQLSNNTVDYTVNETQEKMSDSNNKISFNDDKLVGAKRKCEHYENEIQNLEPAATPEALSQFHSDHTHNSDSEKTVSFLRPTESAAILVGVFLSFAVIGYAGLLFWRRMLEKRYGNRQLLINEDDDFSNTNNFEMPQYELHERFWPKGVEKGVSSCDGTQVTSHRSDLPMT